MIQGTLIVVAVFVTLLLLAGHTGWHGWHLEHEIRPVDLLTLAVNASVALILQYFLSSRAANLRAEKDIIIEDAKAVIAKLRDSDDFFSKRADKQKIAKHEWQASVAHCRTISNALEHLISSLKATACKKCKKLDSQCDYLKSSFFQYKSAVTNDPPNSSVCSESIREQSRTFGALLKGLQKLIFEINTH